MSEDAKKNTSKTDKRYHNTRLLLRNYHEFKQHCIECSNSIDEIDDTLEAWELTLARQDEDYIKSAKRTKVRTQIIVDLIDRFLDVHRKEAENRHDMNKLRRATIIDKMYISDNLTMEKLAEQLECDVATVSRQHRMTINELAVLFFGIEGLKLQV